MKQKLLYLTAIMCLAACGSDDDVDTTPSKPDGAVSVNILTEIETRSTGAAKTLFNDGDEINVWAKSYGSANASDLVSDIKAVRQNGAWALTPAVYLDPVKVKNAFIYAVSPYSSDFSAVANNIPVDLNKQQDLLYSGSYVPVSYTTYTARLTMKHALSLASFNIFSQDYSGAGHLQSITLSGDSVYVKGKMTVEKGRVNGTEKGELKVAFDKTITSSGWTEELPQIWVIPAPFNTKVTKAFITMSIDDKEFTCTVPEVEMKTGFQYIFHLVLTDNGLECIPSQTVAVSLNNDEDAIEPLQDYAVLTITQQGEGDFSSLIVTGDNVFGSVLWGDHTTDSYEEGISHQYATGEQHSVLVETWSSTGFRLKNLKGIQAIDIRKYE